MANKTANLYARIEPETKLSAESILETLGIPVSTAINMFYKQIILQRGMPFDVKLPMNRPLDVSSLTVEQLGTELEKGFTDIASGRTRAANSVFDDIRRDYDV